MPRLKMLKPRLPVLGSIVEEQLKRAKSRAKATGRDADTRRTLKLNTAAWQRLRAMVIAEEPLCRHCSARGLIVPASDVDHISGDPSDNSRGNLQSLCHECHSRKTAADHGKRVAMGCDANGWPVDANHHWKKSPATDCHRPPGSPSFNANCED